MERGEAREEETRGNHALCYLPAEGTNAAPSSPTLPGCLAEGSSAGTRTKKKYHAIGKGVGGNLAPL